MSQQDDIETVQRALTGDESGNGGVAIDEGLNPFQKKGEGSFGSPWWQLGGTSADTAKTQAGAKISDYYRNKYGVELDVSKLDMTNPGKAANSAFQQYSGLKSLDFALDRKNSQTLKSLAPLIQLKNQQVDRQNQWGVAQGTQQLAGLRYQADSTRVLGKYGLDAQKQLAMLDSRNQVLDRAGQLTANLVQANRLR